MASTTTGSSGDLLQCSVCLDVFQDPHLLPGCGHTFCRKCIEQLLGRCPICRDRFQLRQVRPNFALRELMSDEDGNTARAMTTEREPMAPIQIESTPLPPRQTESSGVTYENLGVPPCLARLLAQEDTDIALRIFLLDNSGSMSSPDGHVLVSHNDAFRFLPATRWDEVKQMALEQARWNLAAGTPAEFILLNSPTPAAPQEQRDYIRVVHDGDVEHLQILLEKNPPRGGTPLVERIHHIRQRLQVTCPNLSAQGKKVMLTIATDGVPSGTRERFVDALRRITLEMPVNIVIRLATDEDDVVHFYNKIDEEVELPLDILDDLRGEAKEIYSMNPWLTYSPLIHRVREGGTLNKLFDLLDERRLMPMEVALFTQLLLRGFASEPFPRDPEGFLEVVERELPKVPPVWDARRARMAPPVDLHRLRHAMYPRKRENIWWWVVAVIVLLLAIVYRIALTD